MSEIDNRQSPVPDIDEDFFAEELFAEDRFDDDLFGSEIGRLVDEEAGGYIIASARAVADAVRSTLGPKGMDKMLISDIGTVTITNDGVTILREMRVDNPIAKVIIEVAKVQEEEAGDGTTTAVVLAGELLKRAERLLEEGVHPTRIVGGFNLAVEEALRQVDNLSEQVGPDDETLLQTLAETSMTGKNADQVKQMLSGLVVDGVRIAATETADGERVVDIRDLAVETQVGHAAAESTLVSGAVFTRDAVHDDMPYEVDDARILLLDSPITSDELESGSGSHIEVDDPSQLKAFRDSEEATLREIVTRFVDGGVNVIFCLEKIDDLARSMLAKEGILALQNVSEERLAFLETLFDIAAISDLRTVNADRLGHGCVRRDEYDELFLVEPSNAACATLLVRGSTPHLVNEFERNINDAIDVVAQVVRNGHAVPGAGAIEIEVAARIREYADGVPGREQLAVNAFADAVEFVPRTLAENAGTDPIDALISLRTAHERGNTSVGLDAASGAPFDAMEAGVIEPAYAKKHALVGAVDAANVILGIDEIMTVEDPFVTDPAEVDISADDLPDETQGLGDLER
ncbi:thermosome subunit beta [Haladaptatus sp. QDMS2]|nr:thermosome subunit beta [Haladaptatus sp. QDMS2]